MKLNKILVTVGLSLAVGMGVGAGLSMASEKQAKETNAATSETTFYVDVRDSMWGYANIGSVQIHMWGSAYNDVYMYSAETGLSTVTVGGVNYVSFSIASYPGIAGMDVYCWDRKNEGNITSWTTFDSFSAGQNLIVVGNNGGNWNARQPVTLGKLDVGTSYTVTKMAVEFVNGEAQTPADWGLGHDTVTSGNSHSVPANVYKEYEDFGGWFTDPSCDEDYEYEGTNSVSANFTIYAKFTRTSGCSGTAMIDLRHSGWTEDAANYAIYYWNETTELNGWSEYVSAAEDQFLVEIDYELGFTPEKLKVVRYSDATDEETWEDDKWGNSEAVVWSKTDDLGTYSDVIVIGTYDDEWNANYVYAGAAKVFGGHSGDAQWTELVSLSTITANASGHAVYSTSVTLAADYDFKIVHGNNEWYGYYSCPDYMTNREYFSGGNGDDIHVEKGGTYTLAYDSYTHSVSITSADAEAANNWAKAFLGVTAENETCTYSMSNWSSMGTAYAGVGMSDEARAIIADEEHIDHGADAADYIAAAVQRYDYVLERYGVYNANTNPQGFVDFAGRVEAGSLTLPQSANVSALITGELINNTPAIIAVVSFATILAVGGFFFLRTRKEY